MKVMQRLQVGEEEEEEDVNGCPLRGSGFGRRREKVCEEAGGVEVQSWREGASIWAPTGAVTRGPSQSPGSCLSIGAGAGQMQARALEMATAGGQLDSVTGLLPGSGSLRVLVSHLEPGTLMGRGLAKWVTPRVSGVKPEGLHILAPSSWVRMQV